MSVVLDSARAKLARANKHFEELNSQILTYLRSDPHEISYEFDEEQDMWLCRIHVVKPMAINDWALLIGDCVHNARSALDHAVWQLASINDPTGTVDDTRTMFPVFDDKTLWKKMGAVKRLDRLHPRVKALVKWLQPYRRGNPTIDLLAILNRLDNEDKHKALAITVAIVEPSNVRISIQGGYRQPFGFRRGPFEDRAVVAHVGSAPPVRPNDVPMELDLTVDVAFRDVQGPNQIELPVRQGLRWVLNCVQMALELLEKYGDQTASVLPSRG